GQDKWGIQRIVLDGIQNHLPADSGAENAFVEFSVDGETWLDLQRIADYTDDQIKSVRFRDDSRDGYDFSMLEFFHSSKMRRLNQLREGLSTMRAQLKSLGADRPASERSALEKAIGLQEGEIRKAEEAAGAFGEGLKMLSTAALREDLDLELQSRDWKATPVAKEERINKDRPNETVVKRLSYKMVHRGDGNSIRGSKTTFKKPTPAFLAEVRNIPERILYFNRSYRPVDVTSRGEIKSLDKAEIFLKGIYIPSDAKRFMIFGYNFADLPTSRDRDMIKMEDLMDAVGDILAETRSREAIQKVIEASQKIDNCMEFQNVSGRPGFKNGDLWKEVFQSLYDPKKTVIGTSSSKAAEAQYMGFHVIGMSSPIARLLHDVGAVLYDFEVVDNAEPDYIDLDELTPSEKEIYEMRHLLDPLLPGNNDVPIRVFKTIRNRITGEEMPILGFWKPAEDFIGISRSRLESTFDFIETYIHEKAHQITRAGDGTREHYNFTNGLLAKFMMRFLGLTVPEESPRDDRPFSVRQSLVATISVSVLAASVGLFLLVEVLPFLPGSAYDTVLFRILTGGATLFFTMAGGRALYRLLGDWYAAKRFKRIAVAMPTESGGMFPDQEILGEYQNALKDYAKDRMGADVKIDWEMTHARGDRLAVTAGDTVWLNPWLVVSPESVRRSDRWAEMVKSDRALELQLVRLGRLQRELLPIIAQHEGLRLKYNRHPLLKNNFLQSLWIYLSKSFRPLPAAFVTLKRWSEGVSPVRAPHRYVPVTPKDFPSHLKDRGINPRDYPMLRDEEGKIFIVKGLDLEQTSVGYHPNKNDVRREWLAYLLGRGHVNTVEIRPLWADETDGLRLDRSLRGVYLTRLAQDYQPEELRHQSAVEARSALLVFNVLIGKWDIHYGNQVDVGDTFLSFDHDVAFDREMNITEFYYEYMINAFKNDSENPQMNPRGYDADIIRRTIREYQAMKKQIPEMVGAVGYEKTEAEGITAYLEKRIDRLETIVDLAYGTLTGKNLNGEGSVMSSLAGMNESRFVSECEALKDNPEALLAMDRIFRDGLFTERDVNVFIRLAIGNRSLVSTYDRMHTLLRKGLVSLKNVDDLYTLAQHLGGDTGALYERMYGLLVGRVIKGDDIYSLLVLLRRGKQVPSHALFEQILESLQSPEGTPGITRSDLQTILQSQRTIGSWSQVVSDLKAAGVTPVDSRGFLRFLGFGNRPHGILSIWPRSWVQRGPALLEMSETLVFQGVFVGGISWILNAAFGIDMLPLLVGTGVVSSVVFSLLHVKVYYDINAPPVYLGWNPFRHLRDRGFLFGLGLAMSAAVGIGMMASPLTGGTLGLLSAVLVHISYNRYLAKAFQAPLGMLTPGFYHALFTALLKPAKQRPSAEIREVLNGLKIAFKTRQDELKRLGIKRFYVASHGFENVFDGADTKLLSPFLINPDGNATFYVHRYILEALRALDGKKREYYSQLLAERQIQLQSYLRQGITYEDANFQLIQTFPAQHELYRWVITVRLPSQRGPPVGWRTIRPTTMRNMLVESRRRLNRVIKNILNIPEQDQTFENTILAMETAASDFADIMGPLAKLMIFSPVREVRDYAQWVALNVAPNVFSEEMKEKLVPIFDRVARNPSRPLDEEDQRLVTDVLKMLDLRKGLDATQRKRHNELVDEFDRTVVRYLNNISSRNREKVKENRALFMKAMFIRQEIAEMHGFPSYAHMAMAGRTIDSPEGAIALLKRVMDEVFPWAIKELARKPDLTGDVADERLYFPLPDVVRKTFELFGPVFGVKIERQNETTWHDDVSLYEVRDEKTDELIGSFYLDLYARDGKRDGGFADYLIQGREIGGGKRQPAVSILSASFPKPIMGHPALMNFEKIQTFYHEFGHVLQGLLLKSRYKGDEMSFEYREVPSELMGSLALHPDVLTAISGHYMYRRQQIPAEVLTQALKEHHGGFATQWLNQVVLSLYDMKYHSDRSAEIEKELKMNDWLINELVGSESDVQLSFTHLMG
ncbi:MAG TPA: M3 family metallopeptidase, partial [Elusimicrobiota bacterium]|nr:M3 family metallopeptidase [Elusimicrobiota bacterium]